MTLIDGTGLFIQLSSHAQTEFTLFHGNPMEEIKNSDQTMLSTQLVTFPITFRFFFDAFVKSARCCLLNGNFNVDESSLFALTTSSFIRNSSNIYEACDVWMNSRRQINSSASELFELEKGQGGGGV